MLAKELGPPPKPDSLELKADWAKEEAVGEVAISSSSGTFPMPPLEPPKGFLPGKVLFDMMLYSCNVSGPLLEDEGNAGSDPAVAQIRVSSYRLRTYDSNLFLVTGTHTSRSKVVLRGVCSAVDRDGAGAICACEGHKGRGGLEGAMLGNLSFCTEGKISSHSCLKCEDSQSE